MRALQWRGSRDDAFIARGVWADQRSASCSRQALFAARGSVHSIPGLGELSERLGFRRDRMPGYNAVRDLLLALDVVELEGALRYLMASVTEESDGKGLPGLAIDGKTLRGSGDGEGAALRLLSAVAPGNKWVLTQQAIPGGESEQGVLRDFLSQADLAGYVVTVDALHTQREAAETIIQKGGTISSGSRRISRSYARRSPSASTAAGECEKGIPLQPKR
jgi:hypothetical protein